MTIKSLSFVLSGVSHWSGAAVAYTLYNIPLHSYHVCSRRPLLDSISLLASDSAENEYMIIKRDSDQMMRLK